MDLKEEELLGAASASHWYYVSKADFLRNLTGNKATTLLDIGAGSGFFSRDLARSSCAKSVCCVDIGYPSERREVYAGCQITYRTSFANSDAELVLMMDVLEHVEDDAAFLLECTSKMKGAARFVITVPAFRFLWSGHDVFLRHKRRYSLPELEQVVRRCGLRIEKSGYFFAFVFPFAVVTRLWDKVSRRGRLAKTHLTPHRRVVNRLLRWLCRLELMVMPHNRIAGLTAYVLARKS